MAASLASAVHNGVNCAKLLARLRKQGSSSKLFPVFEPLKSVPINILGQLPKSLRGFQYVIVIANLLIGLV